MRGTLTVFVIMAALLLVVFIGIGQQRPKPVNTTPVQTPPAQQAEPQVPPDETVAPEQATPAAPEAVKPAESDTAVAEPPKQAPAVTTPPPSATASFKVKPFHEARVAIIGSTASSKRTPTAPDNGYKLEVDLSAWGASILRAQLADHDETVLEKVPYVLIDAMIDPAGGRIYPFAARTIVIDGVVLSLADQRWELTYPVAPGQWRTTYDRSASDAQRTIEDHATYELTIVNAADDKPVLKLRRTFSLVQGSYHLRCVQEIVSLTDRPLQVQWEQRGHGEIMRDRMKYMGDRRSMVAGYLSPREDATHELILSELTWTNRVGSPMFGLGQPGLLGDTRPTGLSSAAPFWPHEDVPGDAELVWFASVNRYFALVTHPDITAEQPVPGTVKPLDATFPSLQLEMRGKQMDGQNDGRVMAFVLKTDPLTLAAGKTIELNVGLYAGPRQHDVLSSPVNKAMQLTHLIKYEIGCTWCTFQWLAEGLMKFLSAIHFLVRDWAIGIIFLVILVRSALHPITKKAQVQMMTMGKQMQSIQPELEKLKKKYKDNQQALSKETMKLYRTKGINPAGVLGCMPMFLQMPIWIALYAMLFLAIELRHQPAFYGFFQLFGNWGFLADLSSPDALIRFAAEPVRINFPLLSQLDFSTLNILPLLWAVVMFFQQKYMTPPAANDQQAQQQKMMKYMTLLFPIFLYSAPSGLTLYILASSGAGIVDSKLVRKHIKQQEEAGTLLKPKKPPKAGGIMDRLAKGLEQRQKELAERQRGGGGKSRKKKR